MAITNEGDRRLLRRLLDDIGGAMDAADRMQRSADPFELAHALSMTATRLEGLVRLLEVYDCGSTGGFGEGQVAGMGLRARATWLLEKYEKELTSE